MPEDPMLVQGRAFLRALPDAFVVLIVTVVLGVAARNYGYTLHMWGAEPALGYHGWHHLVWACLLVPLILAGAVGLGRVSAVVCVWLILLLAVAMQVSVTEPGLLALMFEYWQLEDAPMQFVIVATMGCIAIGWGAWLCGRLFRRKPVTDLHKVLAGGLIILAAAPPLLLFFGPLGYAMVVHMDLIESTRNALLSFGPIVLVAAWQVGLARWRSRTIDRMAAAD